ncbi:hypothetical protein [Pseudonocardia acidicola]|uniref:Uncharacterized protein n=1 Tax=Pseudonocardia acidicola TaxID=2724939 RepID=A0ABX1SNS2_9PSEU|nr:hypothetical protein [Pseudonocardia acidicola]NMI02253.1 hypothetical protein [Pseudonocardia acidicola]
MAVSVADPGSAVVWNADVVALRGLAGVWRLLVAVPAARAVGGQSMAGDALTVVSRMPVLTPLRWSSGWPARYVLN